MPRGARLEEGQRRRLGGVLGPQGDREGFSLRALLGVLIEARERRGPLGVRRGRRVEGLEAGDRLPLLPALEAGIGQDRRGGDLERGLGLFVEELGPEPCRLASAALLFQEAGEPKAAYSWGAAAVGRAEAEAREGARGVEIVGEDRADVAVERAEDVARLERQAGRHGDASLPIALYHLATRPVSSIASKRASKSRASFMKA